CGASDHGVVQSVGEDDQSGAVDPSLRGASLVAAAEDVSGAEQCLGSVYCFSGVSGCLDGGGGAGVSAGVAGAGAVRAHVGLGETGKERFGVVDVSGVGVGVGGFLSGLSCFGGGLGLPPGDVREAGDVAVAGTAAGRAVVPGALRGHAVVERGGGVGDVVDLLDGAVPAV